MAGKTRIAYDDLDIKINIGNLCINILYLRYEPPAEDWQVKNHCHSSYELHFISRGHGTLMVNQTAFDLCAGSLYLTGPGIYHEQHTDPTDPMDEYCINFDFKKIEKSRKSEDECSNTDLEEISRLLEENNFWIGHFEGTHRHLFEQILSELDQQRLGYDIYLRHLVSLAILELARSMSRQQPSGVYLPKKSLDDRRRLILDWFLGGESPDLLTLGDLAKKLGLSTRQLNRIIKEYYNMTYKEKLLHTKLQNAKFLLQFHPVSLDEIALMSGFSSSSYLCSVFKKYEGITPTQYRSKYHTFKNPT